MITLATFKNIIFSILIITLFTSCCFRTNYEEKLRPLAASLEKEIVLFYEQHQRLPTLEEDKELIAKTGCIPNEDKTQCQYKGKTIVIDDRTRPNGGYSLWFEYGSSGCVTRMDDDGTHAYHSCASSQCNPISP